MHRLIEARRSFLLGVAVTLAGVTLSAQDPDAITFAAIGDMGTGGPGQKQVAEAMAGVSRSRPFDFILTLGDNFYGTGVLSVEDPQWQSKFVEMYSDPALQVPFHPSLGNHDHQGNPVAEVEYSKHNQRWQMPAQYYTFTETLADDTEIAFFALDTNAILEGRDGTERITSLEERLGALGRLQRRSRINVAIEPDVVAYLVKRIPNADHTLLRVLNLAAKRQQSITRDLVDEAVAASTSDYLQQIEWLRTEIETSDARWKIVYGHHPPFGHHPVRGNNQRLIRRLVPVLVEHDVDLYLAGHDHFLDMMKPRDGVHYVTAGAGAATDNPYLINQTDESYFTFTGGGFSVYRVTRDQIVIDLIGIDGETLHQQIIDK